ncbi:hypothetical protein [Tessaracoccus massiliensis]|uniref:hypothetical protein n=1 Tax=Tessaracoccus massiliensis TaxID=1522311 RepID=UPI000590DDDB|nr:hypothetical protein [Tessaracoccus massiliensis]
MADWQKIREGYDHSSIDWQRLNAYAKKVAAARARTDPAPSWIVEARHWSLEERTGASFITERKTSAITVIKAASARLRRSKSHSGK